MFSILSPLPPPSPYYPSGPSQCTSPKHPVSCIEPGLAISFLHDFIHVSMPRSEGQGPEGSVLVQPSPVSSHLRPLSYVFCPRRLSKDVSPSGGSVWSQSGPWCDRKKGPASMWGSGGLGKVCLVFGNTLIHDLEERASTDISLSRLQVTGE